MPDTVDIEGRRIGGGEPVYVIAEIGINHNGDLDLARELVQVAADAGCDAVKFQKRTPEICVPVEQQSTRRETPWGEMTYLEYKHRVEFGEKEYRELLTQSAELGMHCFASPWDVPSVEFLEELGAPVHKVASACINDDELLVALRDKFEMVATGQVEPVDAGDGAVEFPFAGVSLLMREDYYRIEDVAPNQ